MWLYFILLFLYFCLAVNSFGITITVCLQNLGGGVDLTEEEIESLLIEVDVDGDGVIQYDEFCGLAVTVIN